MPEGLSLSGFIGLSTDKKNTLFRYDIRTGDAIYVRTLNSLYVIRALDNELFAVSGGWFDKQGISPYVTRINGCTYGGSMINITAIASCGLCIEFSNRVRTSSIQKIMFFKHSKMN
jgi:hypothetical protein